MGTGLCEHRTQPGNLVAAATGHYGNNRVGRQTQLFSRCRNVDVGRYIVRKWMADEFGGNVMLFIKVFFERKNAENFIHCFGDFAHTALPPRPDCRADIVNRRYSPFAKCLLQPQIEVRCIDTDKYLRWTLNPATDE